MVHRNATGTPTSIVDAVGGRIRTLRRNRGWTLEELAERAACHPNFLGLLERGRKNPSVQMLERIALGLGVELAALVDHRQGVGTADLRVLIIERTGSMSQHELLRVLRVLDAVR